MAKDEINIVIPEVSIPTVQGGQNEEPRKCLVPFSGKLITAEDPFIVGKNFRTLTNMRYRDKNPVSIGGMTKINTTALITYLKVRNAFHFSKSQPAETHVLAQAYNTDLTASKVYQNITAIPSAGDFSATALWTDSAGAGVGMFSDCPDGMVAYCNGVDTCVWPGDEGRVAEFINFDPSRTFSYDFTDRINNTKTDTANIATLATIGNGIDANTMLMLHLDNNVTDSSPASPHTVTNTNVTFSTTEKAFGTHGAVFNGTTAYLSAPDNADFDFSDGTFTVDARLKFTNFTANNPFYYQKTDVTKISFANGSHEPVVGETIHGNTSAATGIVDYVVVDSGDWGGTAAGTIYMHTITGTWQDAEAIHDPTSTDCGDTSSTASDAGDNYIELYVNTSGQIVILVHECYGTGTDVVSVTSGFALTAATRYHIEVSESANNWYIFVDGDLKFTASDANRAKNYIGTVYVGYDGTNFLKGSVDEYRVSSSCRHTATFTPLAAAYSTATNVANVYVRSTLPLEAIKLYVENVNTSASTAAGTYWDGSSFADLASLSDGTDDGGVTLAQDGSVSFTSTASTAKPKYINGVPLYTYWLTFTGIDAGVTISYCTVSAPFQDIADLWDGIDRSIAACFKYETSYTNYTLNVSADVYTTSDSTTYADLTSLGAYSGGNNCLIVGFFEQMSAFNIGVAPDKTNSTANTLLEGIDYWDGSSFTAMAGLEDGTSEAGISLAKSGTASVTAPSPWLVFQSVIADNSVPLYYYRFRWNQILAAGGVRIYHISGIPAQKQIQGYKFPIYNNETLMLCGNMDGKQNSLIIAAPDTAQVFNGDNSQEIEFGDDSALMCGCTVFSQYGSNLFNITLIFKNKEEWGLVNSGSSWLKYRISPSIGCPYPLTLDTVIIPPTEGQSAANRNIAIWANDNGVYTSEGRHPVDVSYDIRDLFDQNSATHINLSYGQSFYGKTDQQKLEYHLFVATTTGTVTTLDDEWVLDLRRWKWFHVDRTSGKKIQCMINVTDLYGANYTYGFLDAGYMERLEYGTTFDGEDIVSTWQTGDFPLIDGDPLTETEVTAIVPFMVAKATTTENVTITHYIDSFSTGEDFTADPTNASHRLTFPVKPANTVPGCLHSFKGTVTTDDETNGMEPLLLGIYYRVVREHDYE